MSIENNVKIDDDVIIHHPELVNFYGCAIGAKTRIGSFIEIQKNVSIGAK